MAGIGEALRSTRERRGLSIDQVAQDTRISPRFLEALEAEQFDELPAPVYVRGFLRSYANYLRLEAQPLLDRLVGGDLAAPGASEGYVGLNGNGRNGRGRTDPFQRGGVVAPPPPTSRQHAEALQAPEEAEEDEGWAPEPLAPFSPPPADHGYIPGSDLMEAPEYAEPEPIFRQRTAGILTERPIQPNEPGIPRKVLVFGGAVVALLGFLFLAVLLTRGGGDDSNKAGVGGGETPGVTPGTIIPLGTQSPTAAASAVGSTTPTGSVSPEVSTTSAATTPPAGTPTTKSTAAAAAPTATPTKTTPTPVPTSTPTPFPTPTPTLVPVIQPENHAFGECTPTNGSYDCGPPPYLVICYAPLGFPQNSNWWVDVDRSFGALPDGWKEYDGLLTNGQIINAGQSLCATP
ncbi:MAG: helix-turn-helix domain-containing protein [Dehalococcoidia bacterium]